LNIQRK